MNMTVRQLEILVAVGETLSFSQAALQLGVTQPSVSETIKRIETDLGLIFFERTTRALSLTADGEQTLAIAREMLVNFRLGLTAIQQRTKRNAQRLVIATLPSITVSLLPTVLKKLGQQHPQLEIALHDVQHHLAMRLLEDGVAHVALTVHPIKDDGFEFYHLCDDPMLLVCDHQHPLWQQKEHPSWEQIAQYPLVTLTKNSSVRLMTELAFMREGLVCNPKYEVTQIPSAIALAKAGLAISVLPALTLPMSRTQGVMARPVVPVVTRQSGAVLLKNQVDNPALNSLIYLLQKESASAVAWAKID